MAQAYQQILGRTPDPAGLNAAVAALRSGGTVEQMKANLFGSAEFFATHGGINNAFLQALYQGVLRRAPKASAVHT